MTVMSERTNVVSATVDATDLRSAAAFIVKWVPARPAVPLLGGVKVTMNGGKLTLSTFDFAIAATASMDAVGDPFEVVVPGKVLGAVFTKLEAQQATLSVAGDKLVIKAGPTRVALTLLDADNYPALPPHGEPFLMLPGSQFAREMRRVSVAAVSGAKNAEQTPALVNVCIESVGGVVSFTATDRHRLAVTQLQDAVTTPMPEFMVNAQDLAKIGGLFAKEPVVELLRAPRSPGSLGWLTVTTPTRSVGVVEVDATFIAWRNLLVKPTVASCTVDRKTLAATVKRLQGFLEKNEPLRFTVYGTDEMLVEAGHGEMTASELVPVADSTGISSEMTTAFNVVLLSETLAVQDSAYVTINFRECAQLGRQPVILRGRSRMDADDEVEHFQLLMPVFIDLEGRKVVR